ARIAEIEAGDGVQLVEAVDLGDPAGQLALETAGLVRGEIPAVIEGWLHRGPPPRTGDGRRSASRGPGRSARLAPEQGDGVRIDAGTIGPGSMMKLSPRSFRLSPRGWESDHGLHPEAWVSSVRDQPGAGRRRRLRRPVDLGDRSDSVRHGLVRSG